MRALRTKLLAFWKLFNRQNQRLFAYHENSSLDRAAATTTQLDHVPVDAAYTPVNRRGDWPEEISSSTSVSFQARILSPAPLAHPT